MWIRNIITFRKWWRNDLAVHISIDFSPNYLYFFTRGVSRLWSNVTRSRTHITLHFVSLSIIFAFSYQRIRTEVGDSLILDSKWTTIFSLLYIVSWDFIIISMMSRILMRYSSNNIRFLNTVMNWMASCSGLRRWSHIFSSLKELRTRCWVN